MYPVKSGVALHGRRPSGEPLYRIAADRWGCATCDNVIYIGFSQPTTPSEWAYSLLEPGVGFDFR